MMKEKRLKKSKKKKRLTHGKIYRKTLCFIWPRLPYLLLAVIVFLLVFLIFFVIGALVFPGKQSLFNLIGVIAACFAAYVIKGWNATIYKSAHIAMITRGLTTGELPQHIFKEGNETVAGLFESRTLSRLAFGGIQVLFLKIRRKTRDAIIEKRGRSFLSDIRSIFVLYGGNLIPYFGPCVLAYVFSRPYIPMLKAVCDGTEAFARNFLRLFLKMLLILLIEIICTVLPFALLVLILFIINILLPGLSEFSDYLIQEVFSIPPADPYITWFRTALCGAILLYFVFRSFIKPRIMITMIDRYLKLSKENPPKGVLYKKLPAKVKLEMNMPDVEDSYFDELFDKNKESDQ